MTEHSAFKTEAEMGDLGCFQCNGLSLGMACDYAPDGCDNAYSRIAALVDAATRWTYARNRDEAQSVEDDIKRAVVALGAMRRPGTGGHQ